MLCGRVLFVRVCACVFRGANRRKPTRGTPGAAGGENGRVQLRPQGLLVVQRSTQVRSHAACTPRPGQGVRSLHPDRFINVWMPRSLATLCVSSACTRNTLHACRKYFVDVAVRATPRHTMPPPPPTPGAWLPSFDLRQVRQRASRGIRPRVRAAGVLRYRRGEHPGRDRFPAFPGQRGVLRHPH